MGVSVKLHGVQAFLADVYEPTTTLDDFLARIGFDEQQIKALYAEALEELLSNYIEAVRFRLVTARKDGNRLFYILAKRFSFDGEQALTLADLGIHLQISRERVRQLQLKAMRSCRSGASRIYCETTLHHFIKTLVDTGPASDMLRPISYHYPSVPRKRPQSSPISVHPAPESGHNPAPFQYIPTIESLLPT